MKDWPSYLDLPKSQQQVEQGILPVRSTDRDRTGSQYWKCPTCDSRVGGFILTGAGDDDWGYERDKFCRSCGQKIDWRD